MEFNHGYLNGKEVVVVRSGIGKVNAGICTQILVDDYGVDCVINTGIAGSLRNEINIGDIVISTDAVQHDMDVRVFGYPLGEIPQLGTLSFPADERMASLARSVCEINFCHIILNCYFWMSFARCKRLNFIFMKNIILKGLL